MKTTYLASIAVAALCVVILIAFPLTNSSTPSQDTSVSEVAITTSHYLSSPHFSNNTYVTTKIFLENAKLYYANSNSVIDADFTAPEEMKLFIVNGTIRNDYSTEEIIKWSQEGKTHCLVGLEVFLYDNQGNFVNTLNRGNPLRGSSELDLRGGEEADFKIVYATPQANITTFEVYVTFLDPMPLF